MGSKNIAGSKLRLAERPARDQTTNPAAARWSGRLIGRQPPGLQRLGLPLLGLPLLGLPLLGLPLLGLPLLGCRAEREAAAPEPKPGCAVSAASSCQPLPPPVSSPPAASEVQGHRTGPPAQPTETGEASEPGEEPPLPPPTGHPLACTNASCAAFPSPAAALGSLLTPQVRAIGFGEAHAPLGFSGRSTVRRFGEELLPHLAGRSHALVVELLVPPSGCEPAKEQVERESDAVTQGQAPSNQNEYVTLGHHARALGVTPDILRPSCEQMGAIADADVPVVKMMETIAQLSEAAARQALAVAPAERPLVLLYGGALHNDLSPREGLAAWSYGPPLASAFGRAYLEVDLVLPELIQENESWRKFPWYEAVQSLPEGHGSVLVQTGPSSFALLFPRDAAR